MIVEKGGACLKLGTARAYSRKKNSGSLVEGVSHLGLDGKTLRTETMVGEEKVISGRIPETGSKESRAITD